MTPENLRKSFSFIGPMYVGKSLISEEFGNKTNLPLINIDNLRSIIDSERNGQLSKNPKTQKKFLKHYVNEIMDNFVSFNQTNSTSETLKYKEQATKTVQSYIDLYQYYLDFFGMRSLDEFYPYIDSYNESLLLSKNAQERILYGNAFVCNIINTILNKIDTPVIFDFPGYFGCINEDNINDTIKRNLENSIFNITFEELKQNIDNILQSTQTILLDPGQDYSFRNASDKHSSNSILVNNLESYTNNAKLEISTNGLFFEPNNECFRKKRNFFDIETINTKTKLKNKAEILSICDQIISEISQLEESKEM
ncbi:MAG: hypothetical protein IJW59_00990 [Clostridia bacterium]|nr:hypothetical protein [Clostridia bacterium]